LVVFSSVVKIVSRKTRRSQSYLTALLEALREALLEALHEALLEALHEALLEALYGAPKLY
jgi:hypothetical protein